VGSFSDRRINRIRRLLGPELCTSLGPVGVLRLAVGLPPPRGIACVQIPVEVRGRTLLSERLLRLARRRDLPVQVWTVDDDDEMRRLLDLGVAGVMTDRPALLKEVLQARGEWHE
jgi:glycerophosphoryl diester phosphodiesterase